MNPNESLNDTLNDLLRFPLMEAIAGRRSRRFCMGAEIPDGSLAFKSKHMPLPLNDMGKLLVLTSMGGVTGWHFAIMRHARYAPKLSNYSGSPVGRTFPSAAGFITSELFFTDDNGTYFFPTRDFHPEIEILDGKVNLEDFLSVHKKRIRKLSNKRLHIPREEPYMEGHNTWVANHEGSMLVIPVGDLAQHVLATICYFTQNGYTIYDDIAKNPIPGTEKFGKLVDVNKPVPLTVLEQSSLADMTAEFSTSCYAGMLMLQPLGLGGYMYEGIDRHTILGASGDPAVQGWDSDMTQMKNGYFLTQQD
jgi:hypothetical protein